MSLIAIDYDFTYTADPDFWDAVIRMGRERGHKFICVTGRESPPELHERQIPVEVLCSPSKPKFRTAIAAGYAVDIWIDDAPGTIEPARILEWDASGVPARDPFVEHFAEAEAKQVHSWDAGGVAETVAALYPKDHPASSVPRTPGVPAAAAPLAVAGGDTAAWRSRAEELIAELEDAVRIEDDTGADDARRDLLLHLGSYPDGVSASDPTASAK